jgi:hypothetical protein
MLELGTEKMLILDDQEPPRYSIRIFTPLVMSL